MNEEEAERRRVIAKMVRGLRRRKFRTVENARAAAQVSRGTWDAVERGDRVKDFSLAAVEDVLGYSEGTFQKILDGEYHEVPGGTPLEAPGISIGHALSDNPSPEEEWYERVRAAFGGAMRLSILVSDTPGLKPAIYDIAETWRAQGMRLVDAVLRPEEHGPDEAWPDSLDYEGVLRWIAEQYGEEPPVPPPSRRGVYTLAADEDLVSIEDEQEETERST